MAIILIAVDSLNAAVQREASEYEEELALALAMSLEGSEASSGEPAKLTVPTQSAKERRQAAAARREARQAEAEEREASAHLSAVQGEVASYKDELALALAMSLEGSEWPTSELEPEPEPELDTAQSAQEQRRAKLTVSMRELEKILRQAECPDDMIPSMLVEAQKDPSKADEY